MIKCNAILMTPRCTETNRFSAMQKLTPEDLVYALSDATRLRILMLLTRVDELCVCQLTGILDMVQPKISRHLAILRQKKILIHRREGLWVYYRLHPELPTWCYKVLSELSSGCVTTQPYRGDLGRVKAQEQSGYCTDLTKSE